MITIKQRFTDKVIITLNISSLHRANLLRADLKDGEMLIEGGELILK